jgi:hypothetical protein
MRLPEWPSLPDRVANYIDGESVRGYQRMVYLALVCAGAQGLLLGQLPNAVADTLGPWFNAGWLVLLVLGPILTFIGSWSEPRHVVGLWLQLSGDSAVSAALLAYAVALGQTVYAGRATLAMWLGLALSMCALMLVVRDIRKLRAVAAKVRELDCDE